MNETPKNQVENQDVEQQLEWFLNRAKNLVNTMGEKADEVASKVEQELHNLTSEQKDQANQEKRANADDLAKKTSELPWSPDANNLPVFLEKIKEAVSSKAKKTWQEILESWQDMSKWVSKATNEFTTWLQSFQKASNE